MDSKNHILMNRKKTAIVQVHLLNWYRHNHRQLPWRRTNNPYHIWVSEVMLQQTQVNTVLSYYRKFLNQFPDVTHLASADLQDVLKAWEGMGYYARARNLHRATKIVIQEHRGEIPTSWEGFKKLPGVGDYIAAAVLSIAFDQPYPVIDGNVKRVLARLLQIEAPVNKTSSYKLFKEVASTLLDLQNPGTFNQAMMELGAVVCKPKNPLCNSCPLQSDCLAHQREKINEYPKRLKSEPVPEYHIVVGVVFKNNHVLITQRNPKGLLGGLWEFPGGKVGENEDPQTACIREIKEEVNLIVKIDSFISRVKHAYTHFKIILDVFCCRYLNGKVRLNGPVDYRWIKLGEIDRFPFPKANHKFIPLLKQLIGKS